jgi:hypothetical protein
VCSIAPGNGALSSARISAILEAHSLVAGSLKHVGCDDEDEENVQPPILVKSAFESVDTGGE